MSGDEHRAPADIINGVLTRLVCDVLSLRPEHRAKLAARGLPADEIGRTRFVSAPATRAERARAADALADYLEASYEGDEEETARVLLMILGLPADETEHIVSNMGLGSLEEM